MKKNLLFVILLISFLSLISFNCVAQINNPVEILKNKGTDRANSRIDEGIDAGFDKIEQGAVKIFKKKDGTDEESEDEGGDDPENSEAVSGNGMSGSDNQENDELPSGKNAGSSSPQKLESFTQYDFVPGDKILFFEDFSQDQVGDFPALWTSNGSGEVKTVNIAPGKWLHMNGEDAVYCFSKKVSFPDNFIIEFDIIPDSEYQDGIVLTLYEEDPEDPKEINDDHYPGKSGLQITLKYDGWETKGYTNNPEGEWINGQGDKNPVVREQLNHVIIWIQKRRARIYHQGSKTLDVPTNIYAHTKFNRLLFSGYDRKSFPMVTNLKITTASPDTRSKLITEGKLVTYGITFDVNKASIKPESYGTLKSIADVLKENPGVSVKIVGHSDSDGDDAMNLDLSKRRAESVKNELSGKFGIEASRMETEGAGESRPVAPNDTPANKAMNRRVEFIKK